MSILQLCVTEKIN